MPSPSPPPIYSLGTMSAGYSGRCWIIEVGCQCMDSHEHAPSLWLWVPWPLKGWLQQRGWYSRLDRASEREQSSLRQRAEGLKVSIHSYRFPPAWKKLQEVYLWEDMLPGCCESQVWPWSLSFKLLHLSLCWFWLFQFLERIYFIYVSECFACMYVCLLSCACLVSAEVGRECWIP